ncbi:peptide chain release factor N(5)-glutamine methyltransferase [bacterium]|nr:peptide chain release factor N(5)-glutamine methyltransferase [bacterium]
MIDIINKASEHLREKGFENPRLEVEQMLGAVLGLSRLDLYMKFDRPLTDDELDRFRALYRRRLRREPLQHLIGSAGFRNLEVKTDRRALIPRPETEVLVGCAVDFLWHRDCPVVADIGTGTGVIALSILYEIPESRAVASDISGDALLLAEQNAHVLGMESRITFVGGDMLEALDGRGPFDAIISNPPYVLSGDIEILQPEVSGYEPRIALDGGEDGLKYLSIIARGAYGYLKQGGLLLLECGEGQAGAVREEIARTGQYSTIEIIEDLAGKKRVIKAC